MGGRRTVGFGAELAEEIDDPLGVTPAQSLEAANLGRSEVGHEEGVGAGVERRRESRRNSSCHSRTTCRSEALWRPCRPGSGGRSGLQEIRSRLPRLPDRAAPRVPGRGPCRNLRPELCRSCLPEQLLESGVIEAVDQATTAERDPQKVLAGYGQAKPARRSRPAPHRCRKRRRSCWREAGPTQSPRGRRLPFRSCATPVCVPRRRARAPAKGRHCPGG